MLCTNVLDCSDDVSSSEKRSYGMSVKELRIAQRIVLELYCQYEQSLPFREVVSSEVNDEAAQFFSGGKSNDPANLMVIFLSLDY